MPPITLLPAIRINLRDYLSRPEMSMDELIYRHEGLIDALMKGGVQLTGTSIDPEGASWFIFPTTKEAIDVRHAMERVLFEMKAYKKWESGDSTSVVPE